MTDTHVKWAKQLCEKLKQAGVKCKWSIDRDHNFVSVNFRVTDEKWRLWKKYPHMWPNKPAKKINMIGLIKSNEFHANIFGEMVPQQRWIDGEHKLLESTAFEHCTKMALIQI